MNDWCSMKINREKGVILAELAVSLPVLAVLLAIMGGVFVRTALLYRERAADNNLYGETRIAMERIAADAARAFDFDVSTDGERVVFHYHGGDDVLYFLRRSDATRPTLCRNNANEPVTGDSAIGEVIFERFFCKRDGAKVLRVEMTAKSTATGRSFSLTSGWYFSGQ